MIIIHAIVILSLPQKWISWSVYLQNYLFTYSTHMTVTLTLLQPLSWSGSYRVD